MKIKFDRSDVYEKDGAEHQFNYRTSINAVEKMSFVSDVADLIVSDDGAYEYVLRNLMFDYILINTFTDVDCSDINECENGKLAMTMIEELVNDTMIVDIVKMNVPQALLDELNKALDYSVEHRTGIRINPIEDAIVGLVNMVSAKIGSYDVDAFNDTAKLVSKLNSSDFNVETMLDAYANSDVFKKQQEVALDASAERTKRIQLLAEKANEA